VPAIEIAERQLVLMPENGFDQLAIRPRAALGRAHLDHWVVGNLEKD
jgi:hypothetical protein